MLNGQKEYRVEKDFLGEKQIEADVYYGIRRSVLLKISRSQDTKSMRK